MMVFDTAIDAIEEAVFVRILNISLTLSCLMTKGLVYAHTTKLRTYH
jgi:hypothetical protein